VKVPNRKGIAKQDCPRVTRGEARSVDSGAYRPSPPDNPPKVHLKNLASLRVKHLGCEWGVWQKTNAVLSSDTCHIRWCWTQRFFSSIRYKL